MTVRAVWNPNGSTIYGNQQGMGVEQLLDLQNTIGGVAMSFTPTKTTVLSAVWVRLDIHPLATQLPVSVEILNSLTPTGSQTTLTTPIYPKTTVALSWWAGSPDASNLCNNIDQPPMNTSYVYVNQGNGLFHVNGQGQTLSVTTGRINYAYIMSSQYTSNTTWAHPSLSFSLYETSYGNMWRRRQNAEYPSTFPTGTPDVGQVRFYYKGEYSLYGFRGDTWWTWADLQRFVTAGQAGWDMINESQLGANPPPTGQTRCYSLALNASYYPVDNRLSQGTGYLWLMEPFPTAAIDWYRVPLASAVTLAPNTKYYVHVASPHNNTESWWMYTPYTLFTEGGYADSRDPSRIYRTRLLSDTPESHKNLIIDSYDDLGPGMIPLLFEETATQSTRVSAVSGTAITFTRTSHTFEAGQTVSMTNMHTTALNGCWTINAVSANTFMCYVDVNVSTTSAVDKTVTSYAAQSFTLFSKARDPGTTGIVQALLPPAMGVDIVRILVAKSAANQPATPLRIGVYSDAACSTLLAAADDVLPTQDVATVNSGWTPVQMNLKNTVTTTGTTPVYVRVYSDLSPSNWFVRQNYDTVASGAPVVIENTWAGRLECGFEDGSPVVGTDYAVVIGGYPSAPASLSAVGVIETSITRPGA